MTRDITIKKVLNGFILTVGCATVVFEDRTAMLLELNRYYENPEQVEAEYQKRFGRLDGLSTGGPCAAGVYDLSLGDRLQEKVRQAERAYAKEANNVRTR